MSDGEFFRVTNANLAGGVGMVELDGGARAQMAIFYNKSVHNVKKSQAEGRPVFDDQIYVRVAPPGERLNIVDRPATNQDRMRWPVQWASFQQNREQTPEGTPIELLYPDKPAVAATLRANGVPTIELCAELSANAIENVGMGAQSWVNHAQKYVAFANKGVALTQFRKELEERDGQIRVQAQQIEMLKQEVASLRASDTTKINLAQIQEMVAAAMGRPEMPKAPQTKSGVFDVATAQINATHPTKLEANRRRTRVK